MLLPRQQLDRPLQCSLMRGSVAERSKAPVLKTGNPQGFGGSNPSTSARAARQLQLADASDTQVPSVSIQHAARDSALRQGDTAKGQAAGTAA